MVDLKIKSVSEYRHFLYREDFIKILRDILHEQDWLSTDRCVVREYDNDQFQVDILEIGDEPKIITSNGAVCFPTDILYEFIFDAVCNYFSKDFNKLLDMDDDTTTSLKSTLIEELKDEIEVIVKTDCMDIEYVESSIFGMIYTYSIIIGRMLN